MNIRQIAQAAGVSPATVSRVFNHHPGIRDDVRRRVLEVARRENYYPRIAGGRKNVVILTPYNSIYPVQSCVDMLLMGLTQVLPERGFRLEILPVNNQERLDSIQFCAAAAIGVEPTEFSTWSQRFPVPLIVIDRAPANAVANEMLFHVRSDEAQGMELAIDQLYRRGCRKIGCIIHGTPEHGNAAIRRKAIVDALVRRGLEVDPLLIAFSGAGTEKYVELTGKMLKRGVDAFFCPGGNAGILMLYALSLYGKKIPEDISLIASEQTFFSQFAVPPQTTVTQNYEKVACTVGDLLEKWLINENLPKVTTLPYELIPRESVR